MKISNKVFYYSRTLDGHRASYIETVGKIYNAEYCGLLMAITKKSPVLFLMVEEIPVAYFLISIFRSFFRRRSVGFLFRPYEAIAATTIKLKIKRWILTRIKNKNYISTLTLFPHDVDSRLAEISTAGIYDLQFWDGLVGGCGRDLTDKFHDNSVNSELFSQEISKKADGKKIVVALGAQNTNKGFDVFCKIYVKSENIRRNYLFVVAGKVSNELCGDAEDFKKNGGVLIDRYISDAELKYMYGVADFVWCAYSPSYNQASGIMGRSIQFNKVPIVRKGSVIDCICAANNIKHISFDYSNENSEEVFCMEINSLPREKINFSENVNDMLQKSIKTLEIGLFGDSSNS